MISPLSLYTFVFMVVHVVFYGECEKLNHIVEAHGHLSKADSTVLLSQLNYQQHMCLFFSSLSVSVLPAVKAVLNNAQCP